MKRRKPFNLNIKKEQVYAWILLVLLVFWTISSVLGIVAFARSGSQRDNLVLASAETQTSAASKDRTYAYIPAGSVFSTIAEATDQEITEFDTRLTSEQFVLGCFGVFPFSGAPFSPFLQSIAVSYSSTITTDFSNGIQLYFSSWSEDSAYFRFEQDYYFLVPSTSYFSGQARVILEFFFDGMIFHIERVMTLSEYSISAGYYDEYYWEGYAEGHDNGLIEGDSEGWSRGYEEGKADGYEEGKADGKAAGILIGKDLGFAEGLANANDYTFFSMISSLIDAPIQAFTGLFNFELLGVNLASFFFALLSVCVILTIVKMII